MGGQTVLKESVSRGCFVLLVPLTPCSLSGTVNALYLCASFTQYMHQKSLHHFKVMYASNFLYVLYLSTILCNEMGETRSEFPEGSVCKAANEGILFIQTRVSMSLL